MISQSRLKVFPPMVTGKSSGVSVSSSDQAGSASPRASAASRISQPATFIVGSNKSAPRHPMREASLALALLTNGDRIDSCRLGAVSLSIVDFGHELSRVSFHFLRASRPNKRSAAGSFSGGDLERLHADRWGIVDSFAAVYELCINAEAKSAGGDLGSNGFDLGAIHIDGHHPILRNDTKSI